MGPGDPAALGYAVRAVGDLVNLGQVAETVFGVLLPVSVVFAGLWFLALYLGRRVEQAFDADRRPGITAGACRHRCAARDHDDEESGRLGRRMLGSPPRPLIVATITSADNMRKIEAIRAAQRKLADPRSLSPAASRPVAAAEAGPDAIAARADSAPAPLTGSASVSGVVRGRLTLHATGTIVILDDLRYASDPGSNNCNDMLGMIATPGCRLRTASV